MPKTLAFLLNKANLPDEKAKAFIPWYLKSPFFKITPPNTY
jgi:hypothetical protein